jgi:N-acyl homoserine lactone hydrolase
MKMYVLRLGAICLDLGSLAPGVADGTSVYVPVLGYLVKLDNGEALLVDTGIHRSHIGIPGEFGVSMPAEIHMPPRMSARPIDMVVRMRREDWILRRLAELDVAPSDVRHVINTHLHYDHAGNNRLFTEARFYVQRDHYSAALDNAKFPNEYWNHPELDYHLVDGEEQLFPGVRVVPTFGHAIGHQSVVIELPRTGTFVLSGDAIFCREQLENEAWGSHPDPASAADSARLLQELSGPEDTHLIFGHDPVQGLELLRPPFYYD